MVSDLLVDFYLEKILAFVLFCVLVHSVVKKLFPACILQYNFNFGSKLYSKHNAWKQYMVHAAIEQLEVEFFEGLHKLNDFICSTMFLNNERARL